MPEFLDENLTPEELKGGFEPTDKDDETFLLESLDKYPGILPYEAGFPEGTEILKEISGETIEVENSIDKEESLGELPTSTKDQLLESDDEIKVYEKSGLIEDESEQVPYEKSDLVEEESERISYEKSGLIEDESEQVPYEKSVLVGDESVDYKKSGIIRDEVKTIRETNLHSAWDLFEEETTPPSEDTKGTQEKSTMEKQGIEEVSGIEPKATIETTKDNIIESISSEIPPKNIEETPVEINITDYNEEEFEKFLGDDFRKEIEGELEQSRKRKEKVGKEAEYSAVELTTAEKEELQRDLDDGKEKVGVADSIEIDLTAIDVKKPSEFLAYEMRGKVNFADFIKATLKVKKTKESTKKKKGEKKAKKLKKLQTIQPIAVESSEVPETLKEEAPKQFEENRRGEIGEELPEQVVSPPKDESEPTEKSKKKLIPIWVWFPAAAVILLFIAIGGYLFLINKFLSKKNAEVSKAGANKKQEQVRLLKNNKPSDTVKPPMEHKVSTSESDQIAEKSTKSEPKPEQMNKPNLKGESKPKISLNQQARTEPKSRSNIRSDKPSIAKVENPIEPPVAKIVESVPLAEYSIEVFSSSEPDEANYWKDILNKKGIDALIKIHKVRNVYVYSVRVGTFKNVEEARAYAKSKGFKNIWIDRIK